MDVKAILKQVELATVALSEIRRLLGEKVQDGPKCTYCNKAVVGATNRGAHPSCYKKISRAIAEGHLTDADAVRRGWLLEPKKGGRPFTADNPAMRLMAEELARKESKRKS